MISPTGNERTQALTDFRHAMETAVADDMVGNLPVDKEALTVSIKGKNVKDLLPLATTVLLGQFYRFLAKISFCPFYTLSDTQVEDDDDEEEKSKFLNDLRKNSDASKL